MGFKLKSKYSPTGDQPNAIEELVDGIQKGEVYQTLEGVTGSGKTFTVANVINKLNKHCLLYTSPSPRDRFLSRMPSSA